jgi:hypothetical protein
MKDDVQPSSFHGLSRVYRAVDMHPEAMIALRPALLCDGDAAGLAWVTRARLKYEMRDFVSADLAARRAVSSGCTVGNEILADLVGAQARGGTASRLDAVKRAAELRASVLSSDLRAYYGTHTVLAEAMAEAKDAQKDKAAGLVQRAQGRHAVALGEPMPKEPV